MRHSLLIVVSVLVLFSQIGCQKTSKKPPGQGTEKVENGQPPKPEPNDVEQETNGSESVKGAPVITFQTRVHNFGKLSPGVRTSCEFKFTNTGSKELRIKWVEPTCGCTVPKLEKKRYAPGESGTIVVKYHAGTIAGKFSKRLFVHNDDPDNPKVPLDLKGEVVLSVAYKPKQIKLLYQGDNAEAPKITISSKDGRPFAIKSFSSPGNCITTSFDSSVERKEFVIEPKVDMEKLKRYSQGIIKIGLTHPLTRDINIRYNTLEKFVVNPSILIVQDAKPKQAVERKIWILNNYEEDFEIDLCASREGIIKLLDKNKVGNRYELTVKILPPALEGNKRFFSDKLYINLKSGERLSVDCQGFYSG